MNEVIERVFAGMARAKTSYRIPLLVCLGVPNACATTQVPDPGSIGQIFSARLRDIAVDNHLTDANLMYRHFGLSAAEPNINWKKVSGNLDVPKYSYSAAIKKNIYGLTAIHLEYNASVAMIDGQFGTFDQARFNFDGAEACVTVTSLEQAFGHKRSETMMPARVEPWGTAPGYKTSFIFVSGEDGAKILLPLTIGQSPSECLPSVSVSVIRNKPFKDSPPESTSP